MSKDILSQIHPRPAFMLNMSAECFDYIPSFTKGIWDTARADESFFVHAFLRFNVQVIIFVSLASFFHIFLKRLNIPRICAELMAGFVVSPTFMETVFPEFVSKVFNSSYMPGLILSPNNTVMSLAKIGFNFYVFLAGVRMDPSLMWKTGKAAPIMGLLVAAFQFMMTYCLNFRTWKGSQFMLRGLGMRYFFLLAVNSEFVTLSSLLLHLKITNSRLGHIALAAQLTADLTLVAMDILKSSEEAYLLVRASSAFSIAITTTCGICLYLFIVRPLVSFFIRRTPEGQPVQLLYTNLVVAMCFILTVISMSTSFGITNGAFLLGLLIPAGSPLARELIIKLEPIVSGTLVPLLMSFAASKFCLAWYLYEMPLSVTISIVGWIVKIIFMVPLFMIFKFRLREALALALMFSHKGIYEAGKFLNGNIEYKDVNSTTGFFFIFAISLIVPPLVKILYDPKKQYIGFHKKCLQYAPHDAELGIIACAHRQEDAMAVIKLLEYSNPTKESPLSIYGLCLEELVASATPLLIDHQLGQKTNSTFGSRSQPILDIFKYFQSQNKKLTRVSIFTAVSPTKQMHEDICSLSFEKAASLIILPFHKKWNSKTKRLMPGQNDLRTLNIDVLNRAPCSVVILVDRRGSQGLSSIFVNSSNFRVGVLFIGGDDDREALAYALRMAGSSKVELTTIRLLANTDQLQDRWDTMLDNESMRNFKLEMSRADNIFYKEDTITDGSDTASIVQEMIENFDLLIIGRRHETKQQAISGMSEWIELPELGVIGDMLASPDIVHPISIMIVQQQIMKASHSSILNS